MYKHLLLMIDSNIRLSYPLAEKLGGIADGRMVQIGNGEAN
jgi:hypothetical protein